VHRQSRRAVDTLTPMGKDVGTTSAIHGRIVAEVLHEDLSVYRPSLQPCSVVLGPVSRFRNLLRNDEDRVYARSAQPPCVPVERPATGRPKTAVIVGHMLR